MEKILEQDDTPMMFTCYNLFQKIVNRYCNIVHVRKLKLELDHDTFFPSFRGLRDRNVSRYSSHARSLHATRQKDRRKFRDTRSDISAKR